jgi:hypothetical protein
MGIKPPLLLSVLALFAALPQKAVAQESSARELIRFLTYQSDRPEKQAVEMGLFSCGQVPPDRAAAKSLAKLGDPAIPDIEKALDALMNNDAAPGLGFEWLAFAYARIRGPAAFPRLRGMPWDSSAEFLDALDPAIALALSLTSYVSGSRSRMRSFRCRSEEPRDVLDQLIVAWEANDLGWLRPTLGPNAKTGLDSLMNGKTWADLRSDLWHAQPNSSVAVGYKFNVPGRWSGPGLRAVLCRSALC